MIVSKILKILPILTEEAIDGKRAEQESDTSGSEKEDIYVEDNDIMDMTNIERRKSKRIKTLKELVHPISTKLLLQDEIRRLSYLVACFGCGSKRVNLSFRVFGGVFWILSLVIHFFFDIYAALTSSGGYGYTFIAAQGIWFLTFVILTFATGKQSMVRLDDGLRELRHQECYEKTLTKMMTQWRKYPYIVTIFGLLSSGMQHFFLYVDNALHLYLGFTMSSKQKYALHVLRFLSGMHVYSAYLMFWLVPLSIILMTGHSMREYNDQTGAKMRDKSKVYTFKEAISSYSARAKFVKDSSSQNSLVLSILLVTAIICFGINAYVFLFKDRLYLHVWHSLLPLGVMIVPLCASAWVTKQYSSFIIVVVKAWVQRDDLDESSSDEDSGIEDLNFSQNKNKQKFSTVNKFPPSPGFLKKPSFVKRLSFNADRKQKLQMKSIKAQVEKNNPAITVSAQNDENSLAPWQEEILKINPDVESRKESPTRLKFSSTAKVLAKFKAGAKKPRFNFEKFLSYLESMRNVDGFEIGGIMMTWDKVSTTLFFLFSIVAVFMQESIFGSAKTVL